MAILTGDGLANTLTGTPGEANTILGLGGDDSLSGAELADLLDGGAGSDSMDGGAGNDVFAVAGREAYGDRIEGGAGTLDMLRNVGTSNLELGPGFAMSGVERIDGNNLGIRHSGGGLLNLGTVWLFDVSWIAGRAADDTILCGVSDDTIYGNGGADQLSGGSSFDWIYGGTGSDSLIGGRQDDRLVGGRGRDILAGGTKSDGLFGGLGNDLLRGGGATDRLSGGAGGDRLGGGKGADEFIYRETAESGPAGAVDRIRDFETGTDLLDLSRIDAIAGGADDAFAWLGATGFGGNAGELVLQEVTAGSGDWHVLGDTDGDAVADLRIRLDRLGPATLFGDADILN
jgi:Ca2+-binding RTX toxin-like protein